MRGKRRREAGCREVEKEKRKKAYEEGRLGGEKIVVGVEKKA